MRTNKKPLAKTGAVVEAPSVRDPFAFLRRMTSELDRVFDEPRWPFGHLTEESRPWTPTMELVEKDNRLIARVELPGTKPEDLTVEVADGQVSVSGERTHEEEETKENVYRCEREYGSFYRSFPLPEGATADQVTASMTDGVLEVSMPIPKAVDKPTHKVNVTAPSAKKTVAAA